MNLRRIFGLKPKRNPIIGDPIGYEPLEKCGNRNSVESRLRTIGLMGFIYLYPFFKNGNPETKWVLNRINEDQPGWKSEMANRSRISQMRTLKKLNKFKESLEFISKSRDYELRKAAEGFLNEIKS